MICLILFFGSASIFRNTSQFILFFDQSVNGLQVGSPVKFRGVPVGSVERILIRAEGQKRNSTAIPVIITLDYSRLEKNLGGVQDIFAPTSFDDCVGHGLVAQLNLESVITGQLFVEFTVEPDKAQGLKPHLKKNDGLVEIPTLASYLDQVTTDLVQLVSSVNAIDLPRLNQNVNRVLENMAVVLEGVDSKGISDSVKAAAGNLNSFIESGELTVTLQEIRTAVAAIRATVKTYDLEEGPMAETVRVWTNQFTKTLAQLDQLLEATTKTMGPDSNLRYELENSLRELGRASRSIRQLAEYLERNPNALLTGRPEAISKP